MGGAGCFPGCEVMVYSVVNDGRHRSRSEEVISLRMTSVTCFWNCKPFSYYALLNESLRHGEHPQMLLKDEQEESEEPHVMKSLFRILFFFLKLIRELPNLSPNDFLIFIFSNMGSLTLKYSPRP